MNNIINLNLSRQNMMELLELEGNIRVIVYLADVCNVPEEYLKDANKWYPEGYKSALEIINNCTEPNYYTSLLPYSETIINNLNGSIQEGNMSGILIYKTDSTVLGAVVDLDTLLK